MNQRTVKVWNKIVVVDNVPDSISDKELIEMAKKKLIDDAIRKQAMTAS